MLTVGAPAARLGHPSAVQAKALQAYRQLLPAGRRQHRSRIQVAQGAESFVTDSNQPARNISRPQGAESQAPATVPADVLPTPVGTTLVEVSGPSVPPDLLREFEHKLEADLKTVGVTLTAVTGVIIFWRGVWSLLDSIVGDSVFGDICCIFVGLIIVLWIRLSGVKVASTFWPPS
eukprot:jgi/Chrzof1/3204/Cz12g15220.t1